MNGKLTWVLGSTGVLIPGMEGVSCETMARILMSLVSSGCEVVTSLWNNEKASKETFVDGWVHTGDKFYADAGGNFWFVSFTFIFYT